MSDDDVTGVTTEDPELITAFEAHWAKLVRFWDAFQASTGIDISRPEPGATTQLELVTAA